MVLNFKKANCKNCYKCLRNCPVKSISVLNHQAQIIEDKCILCGHCTRICPQDAKTVQNNIPDCKALIAGGKNVVVSLAPSFVTVYPGTTVGQFYAALQKLGFNEIQETAIGAKYVSEKYDELLTNGADNLITSACPSVVKLIQLYHHNALKYLAHVDSPMVAHARIIKRAQPDAKIVFVGPCISKKREAEESKIIDAAITFEELDEWFQSEGIEVKNMPDTPPESLCGNLSLNYPINRGIVKSFGGYQDNYEYICVDGVDKCRDVLENIDSLHGFFIEMSACENSCVNGPCMLSHSGGFIKATERIRRYAKEAYNPSDACEPLDVDILSKYPPLQNHLSTPSDAQMKEILARVGKYNTSDLLNCGACGYKTCIDKAIAVYNGIAESDMCVPYMRERAESLANMIIENSPNGIIAVDEDMRIAEINFMARQLLGLPDIIPKGDQLSDYLNPTEYLLAVNNVSQPGTQRLYIEKTDKYLELSITYVPKDKMVFGIYMDVTQASKQQLSLKKTREETVATTNEVIAKQMRVVQEIASLLGETTAETQVALTKLKRTVQQDEED